MVGKAEDVMIVMVDDGRGEGRLGRFILLRRWPNKSVGIPLSKGQWSGHGLTSWCSRKEENKWRCRACPVFYTATVGVVDVDAGQ